MKHKIVDLLLISLAFFLGTFILGLSRQDVSAQTDCDVDCLGEKVTALTRRVAMLEEKKQATKTTKTTTTKESFVRISDGNAIGIDWTKVEGSDFWFDQSLYGEVTTVTWQGWIENGSGQVRLYDDTNKRAVDGSEIKISADTRASFYSVPLSIWRGQNKYFVQVRSEIGSKVIVSSPRLKVLSK